MRPFSAAFRAADAADAANGVDVLVVGMGATGAGVALDAASRGLSVAVIDKGDLASGTSSKSSKLVHGGLRYLENYEFSLVREGVLERQQLMRLAPHLVRPMDFVYPVWPDTAKRRLLGLGLTTYDVFAGVRNVRRHEKVDAVGAIALAPALGRSGLDYAYVYGDCATDDARLVLSVVQRAREFGAVALTYTSADRLLVAADGAVHGAQVRDVLTGETYEIRARHVVNATGIWVDTLLAQTGEDRPPLVTPSKGVHLVVPHERLPLSGASVLLPSRAGDGRSMFAIPWGRQTILGTTDTAYAGSLDDFAVDEADLSYVLKAGNDVFDMGLTEDDVLGAWAGARPLLKGEGDSMSDLSRRHTLLASPGGLVTITGGKLTTYRRMASDVVDLLVARDGLSARCRTADIPLGGTGRPYDAVLADVLDGALGLGLDAEVAQTLTRQQGEAAAGVLSLVAADPSLGAEVSPAAAHIRAEVVQAARHEGVATLDDVYSRRMRLSLRSRDAAMPSARWAADVLAAELGRPAAWAADQVSAYAAAVAAERGALGAAVSVPA